jgi:hypothetical protein
MTVALAPVPKFQALGFGGLPLPGGKLFTFIAGTSTPQATYTDSTQTQQNQNPIIMDANGQADVWLVVGQTYKLRLTDFFGNQIWVVDQVQGGISAQAVGQLLYPQTPTEVTAAVLPSNFLYPAGNILRYADNTVPGVTPMDVAFSNAVNAVCPLGPSSGTVGKVYLPAGVYFFANTWNLTNTRSNGTPGLDGLIVEGDGMDGTVCQFGTGPGHAMVETTGSQWLKLRQIQFTDTGAVASLNKASVGIYQAVQTGAVNGQTQNQRFENILVSLTDNALANGNLGTVALWNFGSEESTYDTVYMTANIAVMLIAENPPGAAPGTPPVSYVSANLASSHSLGVTTFSGECFLATVNQRQPCVVTENVGSVEFENTFASNIGLNSGTGGGSNDTFWGVYGGCNGPSFNGLVETFGRFMDVHGAVIGGKLKATIGNVQNAAVDRINLERGGQGIIVNSEFTFDDVTTPSRPLFTTTVLGPQEITSCYITNCIFRVNCDKQFTTIQENILWNPNTGNILIEALHNSNNPYRYTVDSNRVQEVAIPDTACLINGGITSAEVVRFILPTVFSNANALAADVWIEGLAHIATSGLTTAMSSLYVNMHLGIAISNIGSIVTSNNVIFTGSPANQSTQSITGVTISGASGGGGAYVQVILTPTRTGGTEQVNFVGTARMRWAGNESRAPSIQTLS